MLDEDLDIENMLDDCGDAERDMGLDLYDGLSVIDDFFGQLALQRSPAQIRKQAKEEGDLERQEFLARLIFDCCKHDEGEFSDLLRRAIDLLNFTETDVAMMFSVRLERVGFWIWGSEVPPKPMQSAVQQWILRMAEAELGA